MVMANQATPRVKVIFVLKISLFFFWKKYKDFVLKLVKIQDFLFTIFL